MITESVVTEQEPLTGRQARLTSAHAPLCRRAAQEVSLESLLLGLRLRGRLSDREKEFLDELALDQSITFLIHRRRYLHPEGVELFPHELIEGALQQGGEAVFLHRYRPQLKRHAGFTIYTATINTSAAEPLLLGFFGPDWQMNRPEMQDRFHHLVVKFREGNRLAEEMAQDLGGRQQPGQAVIILDREKDRVLSVNSEAEALLKKNWSDFVDFGFDWVSNRLRTIPLSPRTTMTDLTRGPLHLTLITLAAPDRSSTSFPIETVEASIVDNLQSEVGRIKQLAERLKELKDAAIDVRTTDLQVLANAFTASASAAEDLLTKLSPLNNHDNRRD